MFLSKLAVNPRDRQARFDLARPYELHRTILTRGFDGVAKAEIGRVLHRVDTDRDGANPVILVQSDREPHWALPPGYLRSPSEHKRFDLEVTAEQRLRFRLRANPTKRVHERATSRPEGPVEAKWAGKRVGLLREEDQLRWLLHKGDKGGFRIPGHWVDAEDAETAAPIRLPNFRVDVIPEGNARHGKPGFDGTLVAVRYEGVLVVTDPDAFRRTVATGVGSAKGYGFGLLSIAPA